MSGPYMYVFRLQKVNNNCFKMLYLKKNTELKCISKAAIVS